MSGVNDFVGSNTIDVIIATAVLAMLALVIAVWAVGRRRKVRRLSRLTSELEYRVHLLEVAEHERKLRRIKGTERVEDA